MNIDYIILNEEEITKAKMLGETSSSKGKYVISKSICREQIYKLIRLGLLKDIIPPSGVI